MFNNPTLKKLNPYKFEENPRIQNGNVYYYDVNKSGLLSLVEFLHTLHPKYDIIAIHNFMRQHNLKFETVTIQNILLGLQTKHYILSDFTLGDMLISNSVLEYGLMFNINGVDMYLQDIPIYLMDEEVLVQILTTFLENNIAIPVPKRKNTKRSKQLRF
jgi:hypothetical protein